MSCEHPIPLNAAPDDILEMDFGNHLWSGLVVCTIARSPKLTKGRLYEVKNGSLRFDDGSVSLPDGCETTFENFCCGFESEFIEYKGDSQT